MKTSFQTTSKRDWVVVPIITWITEQNIMTKIHEITTKRNIEHPAKSFIWITNYRQSSRNITKTYLYNFDPLKPHIYIVKLGFIGVYIIFLISAQNIDCGYSLEPPRRGGSNEYRQSMFWAEIWKISEFFIWIFSVFGDEIFYIFE